MDEPLVRLILGLWLLIWGSYGFWVYRRWMRGGMYEMPFEGAFERLRSLLPGTPDRRFYARAALAISLTMLGGGLLLAISSAL